MYVCHLRALPYTTAGRQAGRQAGRRGMAPSLPSLGRPSHLWVADHQVGRAAADEVKGAAREARHGQRAAQEVLSLGGVHDRAAVEAARGDVAAQHLHACMCKGKETRMAGGRTSAGCAGI